MRKLCSSVISIILAAMLIAVLLLVWELAKMSTSIFVIVTIVLFLISSAPMVWDFFYGPLFELDGSGFVPQTMPIAAASLVSGWVTYQSAYSSSLAGVSEESFILLFVGLFFSIVSIIFYCEGAHPLSGLSKSDRKKARGARLADMAHLLLSHVIVAFAIGFLVAKDFG